MATSARNMVEDWYLRERGITPDTLDACRVETTDEEARWKVGGRYKYRKGFGGNREFGYESKGELALWNLPVKSSDIEDPVIVCEGETDAMRLWQDGGKDVFGMISAMPGCDAITPEIAAKLKQRSSKTQLYFVLDNDSTGDGNSGEDYNPDDWKQSQAQNPVRNTNDSWQRIKKMLPKARRIHLPPDYKDICEYLNIYKVKDFEQHVLDVAQSFNFDALDLSMPMGDGPKWLWADVIPSAQFVLNQGESNVGKSFLYLGLAVALANGESEFLGRKLNPTREGRVFIVDEENPEDEVRSRLVKLGLTAGGQKKIHIVSQRGVRIDMDSDKLYDDVEAFNPDLVILDSLIRLHMQDENSAQAISGMFNVAVLPISRQLGCAVWLLHHVNRTDSGDSRRRTRGSTDIMASCDMAWDLVDHIGDDNTPVKLLSRFKSRNGKVDKRFYFRIDDTDKGGVAFNPLDGSGAVL